MTERVRKRLVWWQLLLYALIIPFSFFIQEAASAAEDKCLDNNGLRTIAAGSTYSDTTGTWVCSPTDTRASSGGWLLTLKSDGTVPDVQPTAVLPAPRPLDVPQGKASGSGAGLIFLLLLAALLAAGGFGLTRAILGKKHQRELAVELGSLSEKASNQMSLVAPSRAAGQATPPVFSLEVVAGPQEGARYDIGSEPVTIGSGATCKLRLETDDGLVATEHARVWARDGRPMFHHLSPAAKSLINGKEVTWVSLADGDSIQVGHNSLRVRMIAKREPTAAASSGA